MKKLYTLFALLFLSLASMAQAFTKWTFEGDVTTPAFGAGTLTNIGGTTNTFATGADSSAAGYNTATYPAQGTASGTAGVEFATSTAGRQGIIVSWQQRNSNTSSKFVEFQYSANGGTTWVTPDLTPANTAGTEQVVDYVHDIYYDTLAVVFIKRVADLSAIPAVNNNANFRFRIVAVFSPDSAKYAPAFTGSTYGVSGTQRFDNVTIGANGLLPVRLGAFSASVKNGNDVTLKWSTYSEAGFSHFEVEKALTPSADHFASVGNVVALNTLTGATYSYTDHAVESTINYYRLKMVDKNGNISYSAILPVKAILVASFLATPNPVRSGLTISHAQATNGARLQVFAQDGKQISSYAVQADANQTVLDVSGLAKGTYILVYRNSGTITSTKFIKL